MITGDDDVTTVNEFAQVYGNSFAEPSDQPLPARYVYHYKVRSFMPNGTYSMFSSPGSFMISSPADTPALLAPSGTSPLAYSQPLFSWTPVDGAVGYELQVMSQDEQTVYLDQSTTTNGFNLPASNTLQIGSVYHWRVRSLFSTTPVLFGETPRSQWSTTSSFEYYNDLVVPYTLGSFGIVNNRAGLVLEWSQITNAVGYDIQILDSATQALLISDSILATSPNAPDTFYDLRVGAHPQFDAIFKTDHSYDWSVRARLSDGTTSIYSLPKSFNVAGSLKSVQAWIGLIGDPTYQLVTHEVPYTKVTQSEVVTGVADYSQHLLNVDYYQVTQVGKIDLLDTVAVVVPQLNLPIEGVLRYHFVLRGTTPAGLHATVWSGDGQIAASGQVQLNLPSDVANALVPAQPYYFVVQAFNATGTLLGEAERQYIPAGNWSFNSTLGDYVVSAKGGVDNTFLFKQNITITGSTSKLLSHGQDSDSARFMVYVSQPTQAQKNAAYAAWLASLSAADQAFYAAWPKATTANRTNYTSTVTSAQADYNLANENAGLAYTSAISKAQAIYRSAVQTADEARATGFDAGSAALASAKANLVTARAAVTAANAAVSTANSAIAADNKAISAANAAIVSAQSAAASALKVYNSAVNSATNSKTKVVNAALVAVAQALNAAAQAAATAKLAAGNTALATATAALASDKANLAQAITAQSSANSTVASANAAVTAANALISAANTAYSKAMSTASSQQSAAYIVASAALTQTRATALATFSGIVAAARASIVASIK